MGVSKGYSVCLLLLRTHLWVVQGRGDPYKVSSSVRGDGVCVGQ